MIDWLDKKSDAKFLFGPGVPQSLNKIKKRIKLTSGLKNRAKMSQDAQHYEFELNCYRHFFNYDFLIDWDITKFRKFKLSGINFHFMKFKNINDVFI